MSTKVELVRELMSLPESPVREKIIRLASIGHYHDFESTVATPKIQLVKDLSAAGYFELAERVRQGEFDE